MNSETSRLLFHDHNLALHMLLSRKSLGQNLKASRFNVHKAKDGREALQKSRPRLSDVALVDIRLPDMDGIRCVVR